ncbi:peptidoglycan editing factor PgeF [Mollicutes bacterium LVI A0078]|nr:peptidoglycan editing factor PgeF [Mollicutes bacterium LVI A0075]WOO91532.1 peptidoglycan editing factor PgeF [Mollicutes bacterium LVI A0078]
MERFVKDGIVYDYQNEDYKIVFTNIDGGNMAYQAFGDNVLENRKAVASKINRKLDDFIFAKQCHSSDIAEVKSSDKGRGVYSFEDGIEDVDCLYTFDSDVVLCAFYADCTPVYIMSKKHNLSCMIHAGWQGTVKAIVYKAIEHFKTLGIEPSDLEVVIGPSISFENFEVESDVIELINKLDMIETNLCYTQINDIKYKADVKLINKLQAVASGVPETNIYTSQICTVEDENLFSFRQNNQTGRMIACIYKK